MHITVTHCLLMTCQLNTAGPDWGWFTGPCHSHIFNILILGAATGAIEVSVKIVLSSKGRTVCPHFQQGLDNGICRKYNMARTEVFGWKFQSKIIFFISWDTDKTYELAIVMDSVWFLSSLFITNIFMIKTEAIVVSYSFYFVLLLKTKLLMNT